MINLKAMIFVYFIANKIVWLKMSYIKKGTCRPYEYFDDHL